MIYQSFSILQVSVGILWNNRFVWKVEGFMKKKKIVLLVVVGVLIGAVFIWRDGTTEETFSVHDLNWDDYEGMNEQVMGAFYTDSPHVYDASVGGIGYHEVIFRFFRDNLDFVSDRQRGNDLGYRVHFTNITGEESFLGNIPPSVWEENAGEFELNFYFDRSLSQEFWDVLIEASREYAMALNPDAFNEVRITLAEVDWDALRDGYEEQILSIVLEGSMENSDFHRGFFRSGRDNLPVIFQFLEDYQEFFSDSIDEEYKYTGIIHFIQINEEDPLIDARFYMNEELSRRLMDVIGEEAWEAARR